MFLVDILLGADDITAATVAVTTAAWSLLLQEFMLETLEAWGFDVARPRLAPTEVAQELVEFHRRMVKERSSLGYAVDGVVYKLNDLSLQVSLSDLTIVPASADRSSQNFTLS